LYEVGDAGQTPESLSLVLAAIAVTEEGSAGVELDKDAVLPDGQAGDRMKVATPAGTFTVFATATSGAAWAVAVRPTTLSAAVTAVAPTISVRTCRIRHRRDVCVCRTVCMLTSLRS
jgi:hypothetical protein